MNSFENEVQQSLFDDEESAIAELKKQYQRALNDIGEKIRILQSDDLTASKIYQVEYQKALKGQIEGILAKMTGDNYTSIQQYLNGCYINGFFGTMYSFHGQGVPLILPIDQNALVKAVLTDSKINGGLYASLGVDAKRLKKVITAEITRGLAADLPYSDIARNINSIAGTGFSNAKRIVRTEGHRIQQAATYDAQLASKANGAEVFKQWDATLDGDTRETHRILDGQIREIDKPFEAGGKKAMYPGGFGDPSEDCNCRCVSLTRPRWALDDDELQTLKERAAFFGLDMEQQGKNPIPFRTEKWKQFEGFKEKYLKAVEENTSFDDFKELTLEEFKDIAHKITGEERKTIYGKGHFSGYVNSSNARKINDILRHDGELSKEYQDIVDTLQRVIDKNVLPDNLLVTRYVNIDAFEPITGLKFPANGLKIKAEDFWSAIESLPEKLKNGVLYPEKGFLSTSGVYDKNVMSDKQIKMRIFAPKGTPCYITTNNKESEIIFGQNTNLKITSCEIENSRKAGWKIVLNCIIV